jgi:superfamily II DNA or RNA helicase
VSAYQKSLWFDPQSVRDLAEPGAWMRGTDLYRSQKVLSLEIDPMRDHWLLTGHVQGSLRNPYEVSIQMALTPDARLAHWSSDCECPVGSDCKHGVALLLKAAYQGLHQLGPRAAAVPPVSDSRPSEEQKEAIRQAALARAQELARIEAEAKLLGWLQSLEGASGEQTPNRPQAKDRPERAEQHLYLLSLQTPKVGRPLLCLKAVIATAKAMGGWNRPKGIRTQPYTGLPKLENASAQDREVLELIRAMPDPESPRYGFDYSSLVKPYGKTGLLALAQAAATGRLFLDDGKGFPGQPIAWGPVQEISWQWQETVGHAWVLQASLAGGQAQLCLNKPPLYLDLHLGLCGPVHAPGITDAQLDVLLNAPTLQSAALKKYQAELAQRLGAIPLPPVLEPLTPLQGITPKPCLSFSRVAPAEAAIKGLLQIKLTFDYAGHRGWWAGAGSTVVIERALADADAGAEGAGRFLLYRDAEAELNAMTRLLDFGLRPLQSGVFSLPGAASQVPWLQWADSCFAPFREAGFEVSLDDTLDGWITHAQVLDIQLQPQKSSQDKTRGDNQNENVSGRNNEIDPGAASPSPWFDLSLGMEINGQRYNILPLLPELIAAAAQSPINAVTGLPEMPPFVYLPDPQGGQDGQGGFIRLPSETLKPWMSALLELVGEREHDFSGETLRLSRLDAMRTTAALGEGAVWAGAQALREMVQRLSGRADLPKVKVPKSVKATLRPYQQQGLSWLQFLREHQLAGILADDMGLGKTLQTLAHIQLEKDAGRLTHPALIIAPVSLMGNWRNEAERFCPQLRCLVIHGKDRHEVADTMAEFDLVIAPYSLLQRDKERWLQAKWHLVVLDEAQNIKNASTHAALVASQLQTRHRLCLSGTPMENHLGEIWSLFHFLMPGFLGSQQRFKDLFRTPIEKQGDPERLHQLRARITPFMLRRTKDLVAAELPPKVETIQRVELSGKQADLYETIRLGMEKTVREALASKGLAKSQITILDALLKLRQVCCDPHLLKLPAAQKVKTSAKLEQLMELLPEMVSEGRRILLFSQFTSMLTLIEAELKKRDIPWVKLTGQSQHRDAIIEQFTSGQVPLFLISLKAGGVGLNLPQADTVIHYDPWWNPAVENQATDRAHRIGQKHTVFVYKLVAQGTIEERILALQERKAALAQGIYSGAVGRKQPLFTEGDLAELLKPLSQ